MAAEYDDDGGYNDCVNGDGDADDDADDYGDVDDDDDDVDEYNGITWGSGNMLPDL